MVFGWLKRGAAAPAGAVEDEATRTKVKTSADEVCIDINDPTIVCYFDPFSLEQRKKDMSVCDQFKEEREAVQRGDVPATNSPLVEAPLADEGGAAQEEGNEDEPTSPLPEWTEEASKEVEATNAPASPAGDDEDAEDPSLLAARIAGDDNAIQALINKESNLVEELRKELGLEYAPESEDPLNQKKYKLQLELLRFIRARKYNVKKAAAMWTAAQEWRKELGMDDVLATPDPNQKMFQCKCPHTNHGIGYEGNPVYIERTGMVRVNEMLKVVTEDQVVGRHLRYMEHTADRMAIHSHMLGRNITKGIMIHDLAHVRYAVETAGLRIFKRTVTVDQSYYPERLHHAFIINAPLSLRAAWAAVQPLLDANTSRKIEILGSNFKERLLEFIPPSQLPRHYGGLCECSHENGDSCMPPLRDFMTATDAEAPKDWLPIIARTPAQLEEVAARKAAEAAFRARREEEVNAAKAAATTKSD